ncbi:MAG: hypothetical protein JNM99_10560 [Verrucomicrobiaceae bacterium]|nr:hypothetical protein [Verrucomicrobiaceae bacterium]
MRPKDLQDFNRIRGLLIQHSATERSLPGVPTSQHLNALVEQIVESRRRVRYLEMLTCRIHDPCCSDPTSIAFDPLKTAAGMHRHGDLEGACWLVFLATHFGKTRRNGWMVVARVYGALGKGRLWSWERVMQSPHEFLTWFNANTEFIRPTTGAAFGNHRKYESLRADSNRGSGAVFESYIDLVQEHGGHQGLIGQALADADNSPQLAFERLFNHLSRVRSFGRTAKFDLLSTLSKLRILPILPGHPYLVGATGPLRGARLLFFANASAAASVSVLSEAVTRLGSSLDERMDVLEDALCNWQKSPSKFVPFRG